MLSKTLQLPSCNSEFWEVSSTFFNVKFEVDFTSTVYFVSVPSVSSDIGICGFYVTPNTQNAKQDTRGEMSEFKTFNGTPKKKGANQQTTTKKKERKEEEEDENK